MFRDTYVQTGYALLDVAPVRIAQTNVPVTTENVKILVTSLQECYVERILNATLTITELFARALTDTKENRISNAPDILATRMMTARRIKNAALIGFAGILVWNKELVGPMHSVE